MANFLKNNLKDFKLKVVDNCIFGRIGFSLTEKAVTCMCDSLYSYLIENNYSTISIANSGSLYGVLFTSVIAERLNKLSINLKISVVDHPLCQFQMNWLAKQTKSFGLYLGVDQHREEDLGIYFIDQQGRKISNKHLNKILRCSCNVKIVVDGEVSNTVEKINANLYLKYLIDNNYIKAPTKSINISIDTMFGASGYLFKSIKNTIKPIILNLYNQQSDPSRILFYVAKPTGTALRWYSNYQTVARDGLYFALDGDGDSLGVFDLKQDTEISPSGVVILLLSYLKYIKNINSGTVVLSRALSDKVAIYSKRLGYTTKITELGLDSVLKFKDQNIILYADEVGRYYFEDQILSFNPIIAIFYLIELFQSHNKSLGEILDFINKKNYIYNNLYLSYDKFSKKDILSALISNKLLKVKKYKKGVMPILYFENNIRVVLKDNIKEETVEAYIESDSTENTLKMSNLILSMEKTT